ncbi:MAG TPA: ribosome small subunit-dependent GTPase, partial [Methylophilaceae bacterium]|nr:ribosome small subunit-dependent GTPase [Methylophilaceae bacterium]
MSTDTFKGQVTAAYGKRYGVEIDSVQGKKIIDCVTRGKKNDVACGDHVEVKMTGAAQGVIESILPRSSLLYRSNSFRSKLL